MGLNAFLSLFSLTILLVFSKVVTADNITLAFEKYSKFSTMSNLFIQTKLTEPISKYQTITVLAVSNNALSSITNKSDAEFKDILMTHVILDYYDEVKLQEMGEQSIMTTTLYQTTGLGSEMNGYLNITKLKGRVYFGSAAKNSPLDAEYISTVYQNPYNLSIIQISMPIVAPGLSFASNPPPLPLVPLAPSHMKAKPAPGPADDDDNSSDTTDTLEADSPAPVPNPDDEEIEASTGLSSSACTAGSRFDDILLLAFFASFAGF